MQPAEDPDYRYQGKCPTQGWQAPNNVHPSSSCLQTNLYAQTGTGLNYSGKYIRYIKIPEMKPQGMLPESSTKRAVRAPNKAEPRGSVQ